MVDIEACNGFQQVNKYLEDIVYRSFCLVIISVDMSEWQGQGTGPI